MVRRHAILDAAVADMLTHGAAALKVERVAVAAGVAKGTVYLYFPSREELIGAAIDRGLIMEELAALFDEPTPITPSSWPDLCASLWTALEERDEILHILARDGVRLLAPDTRVRLRAMIAAFAARWRGPAAEDAALLALSGLLTHYASGRRLSRSVVELLGAALAR